MAERPSPSFKKFLAAELDSQPKSLEVLEVGGGPQTFVPHDRARYTVLEETADALATSTYAQEALLGDAQHFDFGHRKFDIVVFWNVLEHIVSPMAAISRCGSALRHEGLLVIRGPELRSLKSMIARATPHWVHVAFYRQVLRHPRAGEPGHPPFPIEHSPEADARILDAALPRLGFELVFRDDYVGDQVELLESYSPLAHRLYTAASSLIRMFTRQRWGMRTTDFVRVYRRVDRGTTLSMA